MVGLAGLPTPTADTQSVSRQSLIANSVSPSKSPTRNGSMASVIRKRVTFKSDGLHPDPLNKAQTMLYINYDATPDTLRSNFSEMTTCTRQESVSRMTKQSSFTADSSLPQHVEEPLSGDEAEMIDGLMSDLSRRNMFDHTAAHSTGPSYVMTSNHSALKKVQTLADITSKSAAAANAGWADTPKYTDRSTRDTYRSNVMLMEEASIDPTKPLSAPYVGCCGRLSYEVESLLIRNPRLYAIYLLIISISPRLLVILDMYTDVTVTIDLYEGGESIWFMMSCLFIAFPFVLVWAASLRFVQNYVLSLDKEKNKLKNWRKTIKLLLTLYMFPPVGSLSVALYEAYSVIADIIYGFKCFLCGTGMVVSADRRYQAMAGYRKAIEVFAES